MENHKDSNQLDNLTRKIVKDIPIESPSQDFTRNIMSAITAKSISKIKYAPLISWKSWAIAAIILLGLFFIPTEKSENSVLNKVPFDFSFSQLYDKLPEFEGFSASSTTIYAFLFLAVMISIQIFYLKGYFDRKLSV